MIIGKNQNNIEMIIEYGNNFNNDFLGLFKKTDKHEDRLLIKYIEIMNGLFFNNLYEYAEKIDFKMYNNKHNCIVIGENTMRRYENIKKAFSYEGMIFSCNSNNQDEIQLAELALYCNKRKNQFNENKEKIIYMFSLEYVISILKTKYEKLDFTLLKVGNKNVR